MPKNVKLKLTLSDSTIVESNAFSIPDGPAGPAGANGKEYLMYNKVLVGEIPALSKSYICDPTNFNRTPVANETFFMIVQNIDEGTRSFMCTMTYVNANSSTCLSFAEITGAQGATGPAGKDGAKGETGATGQTGPAGPYPTTCEVVEV